MPQAHSAQKGAPVCALCNELPVLQFRMEEMYQYRGQTIIVRAIKTTSTPVGYMPRIVIGGAEQTLDQNSPFPPHKFPEEKNAIEYGKKAAEWIVDNTPAESPFEEEG
jgi:hypothetical protein